MARTMSTSTLAEMFSGSVPSIARSATNGRHSTVFGQVWLMFKVRKERHLLSQLDERSMRDLGLSAADVSREAGRSFLDLPAGRY